MESLLTEHVLIGVGLLALERLVDPHVLVFIFERAVLVGRAGDTLDLLCRYGAVVLVTDAWLQIVKAFKDRAF